MSQTFNFITKQKKTVSIEIPHPGDFNSCYIFGMLKSGSTLLNTIIKDVCRQANIPYVAPAEQLFLQGAAAPLINENMSEIFLERGLIYLGFRNYWLGKLDSRISDKKCILLIRDPRDAIVSHYFSSKYSHSIPKMGVVKDSMEKLREELSDVTVLEYALKKNIVNFFIVAHKQYFEYLPQNTTRIYRYEDVIFYKREWVADMLDFLDIKLPKLKINEIADKYDQFPDIEKPEKFVRQVFPGNYKKHLSFEVINELNKKFSHILKRYGYDTVQSVELHNLERLKNEQIVK
jgi:hypothetical protein